MKMIDQQRNEYEERNTELHNMTVRGVGESKLARNHGDGEGFPDSVSGHDAEGLKSAINVFGSLTTLSEESVTNFFSLQNEDENAINEDASIRGFQFKQSFEFLFKVFGNKSWSNKCKVLEILGCEMLFGCLGRVICYISQKSTGQSNYVIPRRVGVVT